MDSFTMPPQCNHPAPPAPPAPPAVPTAGVPRRIPGHLVPLDEPAKKLTGGSSDYYVVFVKNPTTTHRLPYHAECNDIVEALGMNFAEGNAFKAIWRRAAARQDNGKPGTTALYDAEKVEFFGKRLVVQEKNK
ncbi:hypothetical protein [Amphritea sp. HPY]|uniref:hypothetical protein n=1 Tax=Amphritea sp. HPY TaxID=3421652 RepID=UPI003D7DBE4C